MHTISDPTGKRFVVADVAASGLPARLWSIAERLTDTKLVF
ncbi:hypothetical protein [Catenulispora pinisilvae]|nr:hypothetical protein [Catenulispora pinisilvae]